MNKLILIPTFNEALSLPRVINQIKSELPEFEILVIDDGSTDNSKEIAIQNEVNIVSLPFNVGVGGAVRVGFKYALENNFSTVIQIDADGQHLPSEAIKLLNASESNCVVVGSRFSDKSNPYKISVARQIAMKILAKVTSFICKTKLTDVSSGFRLTTGDAITLFAAEYPRDYLGDTVESLILANKNNLKIIEVPVLMKQRELGTPSQGFIKSFWHLLRILLIISLSLFQKNETRK